MNRDTKNDDDNSSQNNFHNNNNSTTTMRSTLNSNLVSPSSLTQEPTNQDLRGDENDSDWKNGIQNFLSSSDILERQRQRQGNGRRVSNRGSVSAATSSRNTSFNRINSRKTDHDNSDTQYNNLSLSQSSSSSHEEEKRRAGLLVDTKIINPRTIHILGDLLASRAQINPHTQTRPFVRCSLEILDICRNIIETLQSRNGIIFSKLKSSCLLADDIIELFNFDQDFEYLSVEDVMQLKREQIMFISTFYQILLQLKSDDDDNVGDDSSNSSITSSSALPSSSSSSSRIDILRASATNRGGHNTPTIYGSSSFASDNNTTTTATGIQVGRNHHDDVKTATKEFQVLFGAYRANIARDSILCINVVLRYIQLLQESKHIVEGEYEKLPNFSDALLQLYLQDFDMKKMSASQRLILSILERLKQLNWRRYHDYVYEEIVLVMLRDLDNNIAIGEKGSAQVNEYVKKGGYKIVKLFSTRSWKVRFSIESMIYHLCSRHASMQNFLDLTKSPSTMKTILTTLTKIRDPSFPDLNLDYR